nr:uncharacterized protein LOC118973080 [Manis javanica]
MPRSPRAQGRREHRARPGPPRQASLEPRRASPTRGPQSRSSPRASRSCAVKERKRGTRRAKRTRDGPERGHREAPSRAGRREEEGNPLRECRRLPRLDDAGPAPTLASEAPAAGGRAPPWAARAAAPPRPPRQESRRTCLGGAGAALLQPLVAPGGRRTLRGLRLLDSDWNYATNLPGSLACQLHILGLLSLHNQLLAITILLSVFINWTTLATSMPNRSDTIHSSQTATFIGRPPPQTATRGPSSLRA